MTTELWSTTDLAVPQGVAVVILGIIGCLDPEALPALPFGDPMTMK